MAVALSGTHDAYREFIDPLTGDRCRRVSVIDIRADIRPKGRVGHMRVEYIERGIGGGRTRPFSVVTCIGDIMDGAVWREEFRIDLLDHDAEFARLAACIEVDRRRLADIIRANAPRREG